MLLLRAEKIKLAKEHIRTKVFAKGQVNTILAPGIVVTYDKVATMVLSGGKEMEEVVNNIEEAIGGTTKSTSGP